MADRIRMIGLPPYFASTLLKVYGIPKLEEYIKLAEEHQFRTPSNGNWGYLEGKPKIFDSGEVIL